MIKVLNHGIGFTDLNITDILFDLIYNNANLLILFNIIHADSGNDI